MSHPLIDTGRSAMVSPDGGAFVNQDQSDLMRIDSTPLTLMVILLGSAAVLAALKQAGFRFVIGVGK